MRIAIDAQIVSGGEWGGVEQFVMGLVRGLGQLEGSDEYTIVGPWSGSEWLRPFMSSSQRFATGPRPFSSWFQPAIGLFGAGQTKARRVLRGARRLIRRGRRTVIPESNGFYESLGVDVVHFPFQMFVKCRLPTIYNPHDLQHLHYPGFFNQEVIDVRNAVYPFACSNAQAVAADSRWVKDDIIRQFQINPDKVYAIPMGAPTELYGSLEERDIEKVKLKFRLPESFALYPAQTWKHKNHIRLLDALALLRDHEGRVINLVCTGQRSEDWPTIEKHIQHLELENQVRFLGFVGALELRAIYHLAQFVVLPSLFEGGGLPILEAFHEGTPIACSAVTSFPEYAGEAAIFFDPTSVEGMAESIRRMATDGKLRAELTERGAVRIRQFTWERTAKTYRALYRKLGGSPLSAEDLTLLASC